MKTAAAIIAAGGIMVGAFAQVSMQATQDSVLWTEAGPRLVINGKPIFVSGMNIAWVDYGLDLTDAAMTVGAVQSFKTHIENVRRAGGNSVRWWLHNNARVCPKINAQGRVTGLAANSIAIMRTVLDIAYENGVVVSMCLFSHNLLQNNQQTNPTRNMLFLNDEEGVDSYIENALKPILDAIGNHPAVMTWEVFNEPEGMLNLNNTNGPGWTDHRVINYDNLIRFTAKVASYVRQNTLKMVSTGIHDFNNAQYFNRYADSYMTNLVNDPHAFLDFWQVHYYPQWGGTTMSPFHNSASHWSNATGKAIVVGEFPGKSWGAGTVYNNMLATDSEFADCRTDCVQRATAAGIAIDSAFHYLFRNGYAGAMTWALTDAKFGTIAETGVALKKLYDLYPTDIIIKQMDFEDLSGDLAMKLVMANMPQEGTAANGGPWNELFIQQSTHDFSEKENFIFDMYIESGSDEDLMIVPALKLVSSEKEWHWSTASDESFMLTGMEQGKWLTITVPVESFKPRNDDGTLSTTATTNYSVIQGIVLQYFSKGSGPYSGAIYFDNVRVDNDTLFNFNQAGSEWNTAAEGVTVSLVKRPGAASVFSGVKASGITHSAPTALVRGKTLRVNSVDNSELRIKLINVQGRTIRTFKSKGSADFPLKNVPAGRYIVEIKKADKRVNTSAVTVK